MKYLVRQAKKHTPYFEKIVTNQTDNICLVWKALNVLTKITFSCKQTIPSTLTAEVFNDHFLFLAKTLKRFGGGGGGGLYQCSDELKNFYTKRLKFNDIVIIREITAYEVGKYVSNVGSKNTSDCDGISNTVIMLSLNIFLIIIKVFF